MLRSAVAPVMPALVIVAVIEAGPEVPALMPASLTLITLAIGAPTLVPAIPATLTLALIRVPVLMGLTRFSGCGFCRPLSTGRLATFLLTIRTGSIGFFSL